MGQMCQGKGCTGGPNGKPAWVGKPFVIRVNGVLHSFYAQCLKCGTRIEDALRRKGFKVEHDSPARP